MKLFYSAASPYVRQVMIVEYEKGIADRFEQINVTVSPIGRNEGLLRHNPLGKIPCLLLDDGRSLFDSSVAVDRAIESYRRLDMAPASLFLRGVKQVLRRIAPLRDCFNYLPLRIRGMRGYMNASQSREVYDRGYIQG